MSENHTSAPGWYRDDHGEQRWWDGTEWTSATLPPPPGPGASGPTAASSAARTPMPATASGPTGGPGRAKPVVIGLLVLGIVVLLALVGVNLALLAG